MACLSQPRAPFPRTVGPLASLICRSHCVRDPDASCRRNLIGNVLALLRFCNGKGLILSTEAAKPLDMRSPADLMNLCLLFGLTLARAKTALSDACQSVLLHGGTPRALLIYLS